MPESGTSAADVCNEAIFIMTRRTAVAPPG
jgi:hypothetical protein